MGAPAGRLTARAWSPAGTAACAHTLLVHPALPARLCSAWPSVVWMEGAVSAKTLDLVLGFSKQSCTSTTIAEAMQGKCRRLSTTSRTFLSLCSIESCAKRLLSHSEGRQQPWLVVAALAEACNWMDAEHGAVSSLALWVVLMDDNPAGVTAVA